jgi:hypothetical protein
MIAAYWIVGKTRMMEKCCRGFQSTINMGYDKIYNNMRSTLE